MEGSVDQKIKQPESSAVKAEDNIVIHVMPKEFFGKVTIAPVTQQPLKPAPPVIAPKPVPPKVKAPAVPLPPAKKKKSAGFIVILVFVAILAGAVATYFILGALEAPVTDTGEVPDDGLVDVVEDIPSDPVPGIDVDSDGLTDAEELIYMTDYRNPDTDGDTFLDGNEVFHRYDPLGYAPSNLLDTGAVKEFEFMYAEDRGFVVWYPRFWEVVQISNNQIIFKSENTDQISLSRIVYQEGQNFESWYQNENSQSQIASSLFPIKNKEGYSGFMSGDEFTVYLEAGGELYVISYNLGKENTIEYLQTFHMMMNSFKLQDDSN